jgi:hypothetical protein
VKEPQTFTQRHLTFAHGLVRRVETPGPGKTMFRVSFSFTARVEGSAEVAVEADTAADALALLNQWARNDVEGLINAAESLSAPDVDLELPDLEDVTLDPDYHGIENAEADE